MRHIKIYEEYSDDELNDLIGDLKSVGQTPFKPQLGKDYGWTSKLLGESPDPKDVYGVYFTPEAVNYMIEKGMAFYSGFVFPIDKGKEVQFKPQKEWAGSYGSHGPGNYLMTLSLRRVNFSDGKILYQLVGISGDHGFGIAYTKPVGKKARNHCQDQFLDKFKKFTDKEGYL
jgi:hypothetical protein